MILTGEQAKAIYEAMIALQAIGMKIDCSMRVAPNCFIRVVQIEWKNTIVVLRTMSAPGTEMPNAHSWTDEQRRTFEYHANAEVFAMNYGRPQ